MSITLLSGDCRDVLPTLAANSVHCCVCSPPYWNLRDYGTAQWDGGDAQCDHLTPPNGVRDKGRDRAASGGTFHDSPIPNQIPQQFRDTCGKCGARRVDRQIGLEATPDEYLATMVAVFREVKRVLRPDGTCWINLGDSYASGEVGRHDHKQAAGICVGDAAAGRVAIGNGMGAREQRALSTGLPAKNLLLMPARLALALQQDGWWIRSQMPWLKRSCMPESTTDRPTSAIEYVYLLTKSARYFYDHEAVKRVGIMTPQNRYTNGKGAKSEGYASHRQPTGMTDCGTRSFRNSDLFFDSLDDPHGAITDANGDMITLDVNPAGFADAHFATFPAKLVEPLIRAGTSERGCCSACGAPWRRESTKTYEPTERTPAPNKGHLGAFGERAANMTRDGFVPNRDPLITTTGWSPSCACGADVVPATVLDPFSGASTTLLVAQRLQRQAIGIELNPEYVTMGRQRIEDEAGLFADVQTLSGVPLDVEPEIESPDCSDRRSEGSDLDDAQPSLWEWDRELVPT